MRSQAHQIDGQSLQVDIHPACRLRSIGMENNAFFAAQRANGGDVLNHADFVVDEHHADQNGVRPNRCLEHFHVQQPVRLNIQVSHFKALPLQLAAGVEHSFVFSLDSDQVLAFGLVEVRSTLEGQIVGFGRAAGPDDFTRVGTNQLGHLLAGFFNGGFSFPAPGVAAGGRVAEMLAQPGNHCVHHARIAGIGGAVVHVNREVWSFHVAGSLILGWRAA